MGHLCGEAIANGGVTRAGAASTPKLFEIRH
jgi:hypothetical protein